MPKAALTTSNLYERFRAHYDEENLASESDYLAKVLTARIEIVDLPYSWDPRHSRPVARIWIPNGYAPRLVETVDIIESVKNDITCVGHPAVVLAIHHWQVVIQAEQIIERGGADLWCLTEIQAARRNIQAISDALAEGPRQSAISNAPALALNVQRLDLEESPLRAAWERLRPRYLKNTDGDEHLSVIEAHLRARVGTFGNGYLAIETVMKFLKTDGQGFIGDNEDGNSQHPTWREFKYVFVGWYFKLKPATVRQYLKEARKAGVDLNCTFLTFPKSNIGSLINHVLNTPLVFFLEPGYLPDCDINIAAPEGRTPLTPLSGQSLWLPTK